MKYDLAVVQMCYSISGIQGISFFRKNHKIKTKGRMTIIFPFVFNVF